MLKLSLLYLVEKKSLITVQDNTMLKHIVRRLPYRRGLITVQDNTMLKP